jgi:integrase
MERTLSRPGKGARLYLRAARARAGRDSVTPATWCIRDGSREISLGLGAREREEAERSLALYIGQKYEPERRERPLAEIRIADVIAIYLADVAPGQARPEKAGERAERLLAFFGAMTLEQVTGAECRRYAAWREGKGRSNKGTGGGARRDLQDLAAAINHHHKEGLHREVVRVVLPPAGAPRERWLTRAEVARLVWTCLTTRETQEGAKTGKRPLAHLARFILLGVYTGSRPGAILGLSWDRSPGRGRVDIERGLIYRRAAEARETTKRQPPVPIAPELLRLLRRWGRQDGSRGPVVRFAGKPVQSVKTALGRAAKLAGLGKGVTPYALRHSAASWMVQNGVPTFQVAEVLGTSEAMVERHYGHLAPDHLRAAVAAIGGRGVSGAISGASHFSAKSKRRASN